MESTADQKCNICNKYFLAKIFSDHQRLHSEDKFHPCDLCGKVLMTKADFSIHNKKKHTDEKLYSCDICGKAFRQKVHMKTHRRIHTGEKPYACDLCNK